MRPGVGGIVGTLQTDSITGNTAAAQIYVRNNQNGNSTDAGGAVSNNTNQNTLMGVGGILGTSQITDAYQAVISGNTVQAVVASGKTNGGTYHAAGGIIGAIGACYNSSIQIKENRFYQLVSNGSTNMLTTIIGSYGAGGLIGVLGQNSNTANTGAACAATSGTSTITISANGAYGRIATSTHFGVGGLIGIIDQSTGQTINITDNEVSVTAFTSSHNTGLGGIVGTHQACGAITASTINFTRNIANIPVPLNGGTANAGIISARGSANTTISITESYWSTATASTISRDLGYTAGNSYGKNNAFMQEADNFGATWDDNSASTYWNVVDGSFPMLK